MLRAALGFSKETEPVGCKHRSRTGEGRGELAFARAEAEKSVSGRPGDSGSRAQPRSEGLGSGEADGPPHDPPRILPCQVSGNSWPAQLTPDTGRNSRAAVSCQPRAPGLAEVSPLHVHPERARRSLFSGSANARGKAES